MDNKSNPIALYSPNMCGGGAERVVLNIAKELSRRNIAVDVVLGRAVGPYMKEIPSNIRVVDLASSCVRRSIPGLISYFRREMPTAMLSNQMHANIAALLAKKISRASVRLVIREANVITRPTTLVDRIRMRIVLALASALYPLADGVVAVSNGVALSLSAGVGIPRNRIRVIYNPVVRPDLKIMARERVNHDWFRAATEKARIPIIISAGRLEKQKDYETLVRAFSIVRRKLQARLVILGEGEQRQDLERLICSLALGRDVLLPGFVENPYSYMARSSVYVLSSAWEGLPNSLIEAMSLGVPVVSTDCEGGPREILENGRYGYLSRVGDANMLAEGILHVLDRRNYYHHIDTVAVSRFQTEHVVDDYLGMLQGKTSEKDTTGGGRVWNRWHS